MKWTPRMSRWYRHRMRCRALVVQRAGGRCEGCGEHGTSWQPLQWAHLFGRRSEPLSSLPCFTMLLCVPCHDRLDDRDGKHDATFRTKLRWQGITRARVELEIVDIDQWAVEHDDPIGAARFIERLLQQTGVMDRIRQEALA